MKTSEAVQFFNGVTRLARALGIRRQAIYQWGEEPPQGRQFEIQVLTGGHLKAETRSTDRSAASRHP